MAGVIGVQQSYTDDSIEDQKQYGAIKEVERNCDEGKLFIGALSWDTTTEKLIDFMSKFGDVEAGEVKMDAFTKRSRGFGFIKFRDPACADAVLNSGPHDLDGRTIDPKRATKFGKQQAPTQVRTKKIFVGGLKQETTEEALKEYFETQSQSNVQSIDFVVDPDTKRKRGFCFIELDSEDVVDSLVKTQYHTIAGVTVEVKHACSREQQAQMTGRGRGRGGGRGGGGPGMHGGRGGGGGAFLGGYGGGGDGSYGGGGYGTGYPSYGAPSQVGGYGAGAYNAMYYGSGAGGYGAEGGSYGGSYGGYGGGYGAYGATGAAGAGMRDVRYPDVTGGRGAAAGGYGPMSSYTRSTYHPYSR